MTDKRSFKLRRSILSVPGHRPNMHQKAVVSAADVVMLDLEDSVPIEEKESARKAVVASLKDLDWGQKIVTVRINAIDTPFAYRDLLAVVELAGNHIDTVVVPKIDHPGDIHFVSRMLDGIEGQYGYNKRIGIEANIESAKGLAAIDDIAAASRRIETLVFGIADYSASIGARLVSLSGHGENEGTLYPGHRWHFVMSRIVMTAKAYGLSAIDAAYGNFKDLNGLKTAATQACALGFDGKWAIHPGQIDTINQVFAPTAQEIARAKSVIKAYNEAKAAGLGAVAVEGRMVDAATLRMAQQLFEQAKALKLD
jgi:malyl-CoA/(S)-citramalyl-CoA lyase